MQGNKLVMNIGYSHPVEVEIEEGVKVECPSATEITVSGISKERVGHVASVIRAWKKPEPYKGKGIKYLMNISSEKKVKLLVRSSYKLRRKIESWQRMNHVTLSV